MKTNLDQSYEKTRSSDVKKRRGFALLTVMSMIVTSGVLWGLRDTGVTMVNEPLCSYEEHSHTDECYENVLVCGMEEGDEHTHSDECYELALTCTLSEHIHQALCFNSDEADPEDIPVIDFDNVSDEEEVEYDELPELAMPAETQILLARPDTVNTVNNKREGIKFNLFDYGTEALEDGTFRNGNVYEHPKYEGINSGRTLEDDILFLAYGTPTDTRDSNNVIQPSKNHYSADYRSGQEVSGNRPVQGIVKRELLGGFPVIDESSAHSLAYLFNEDEINGDSQDPVKKVYSDVTNLMQKNAKGKFFFYSDKNYAYFDKSKNAFDVYESTYYIDFTENNAGDEHNGKPIGFFPFDPYPEDDEHLLDQGYQQDGSINGQYTGLYRDPRHETRNYEVWNGSAWVRPEYEKRYDYHHHFGMTMEVEFELTEEHQKYYGEEIEFTYSGDDDMWVFIDNVLVLDLGGIHEPAAGQINFTDGYVLTQDNQYGDYQVNGENLTLIAGRDSTWNGSLDGIVTGEIMTKYMRGVNDNTAKVNITSIDNMFKKANGSSWKAEGKHKLQVFYLERGGSYSNLAMEFNLPIPKHLYVEKEVVDSSGEYKNQDFTYQIWAKSKEGGDYKLYTNGSYYKNGNKKGDPIDCTDGTFTLKHGETVEFVDLPDDFEYKVIEVKVNSEIFNKVEIVDANDDSVGGTDLSPGNGKVDVESNQQNLEDNNYLKFINYVIYEETDVEVEKRWDDVLEGADSAHPTVQFKLLRSEDGGVTWEQVTYTYVDPVTNSKVKQRTFALGVSNKPDPWKKVLENLPKRIGNKTYIYKVEEIVVPEGYADEYTSTVDDVTGHTKWIINNKNEEDVEIHVHKSWENIPTEWRDKLKVTAVLKRNYVEYGDTEDTELLVEVVDESGNIITSMPLAVHVGGGVEFSLDVPEGTNVTKPTVTEKCTLDYEDTEGFFFAVKDIEEENAKVTITLNTGKTGSNSKYLFQSTFDNGTGNWYGFCGNNNVKLEKRTNYSYASGASLYVTGRNATWNGAAISLTSLGIKPNDVCSISVHVMYNEGNKNQESFKLSADPGGTIAGADQTTGTAVNKGDWLQLSNTNWTVPANCNAIYIECTTNANLNFYIDEFVIAPAGTVINVPRSYSWDFENNNTNWDKFGGQVNRVNDRGHDSTWSFKASNRGDSYQGPQLDVSSLGLIVGEEYIFSTYIWHDSPNPVEFKVTNKDIWSDIIKPTTVNGGGWTKISAKYTIPDGFTTLYIETPNLESNFIDFYIDDFSIEPVSESNVTIIPNEESVTSPRKEIASGTDDWSRTIELTPDEDWYAYLESDELLDGALPNRSYTFFVEEMSVSGVDGITMADFEVKTSPDDVATNTSDNPIEICNIYKWYKLPETGGAGTRAIQAAGLLLITSGIMSCYAFRKRKRRAG